MLPLQNLLADLFVALELILEPFSPPPRSVELLIKQAGWSLEPMLHRDLVVDDRCYF